MKLNNFFFPFLLLLLSSCKTAYIATSHTESHYAIKTLSNTDTVSAIAQVLKPFRDSMSGLMNVVLGEAGSDFHKEKTGGSLGNLITDAMYLAAKNKNIHCVAAVYNPGGIRLPDIMKGPITKGKMLELLPFDNELVILKIKEDILEQWLHVVDENAWPMSKAFPFQWKQGTLVRIIYATNGQALYEAIPKDEIMYICTNDYVANGGDHCDFLKNESRINTGILIRDILSDYIQSEKIIQADYQKRTLQKN